MKIILIMVSSVNGKITLGDDPDVTTWTSEEDKKLFRAIRDTHDVIIMGSNTYRAAKKRLQLNEHKLRIVLTKSPEKYAREAIPGVLEFTAESPRGLLERLNRKGYNEVLLTGGAQINSLFLADNLVDELHVTIEPKLFGRGNNLISESDVVADMRLIEIRKLNADGTLHLIYRINKYP